MGKKACGEDNKQFQPSDGVLFQKAHCVLMYNEDL